ncbi:MAG: AIR synthase-related protein [Candidatus Thorarchaeota archaeon]
MSRLDDIVDTLLSFDGISRKFVLPSIISRLRKSSYNGDFPHALGEDSAAIETSCDEYILLTTDAIVEKMCLHHPRAAGFNAILANVMDIYAAGGIPTSLAVALSYSDEEVGEELLEGLIDGSHKFRIPLVRGHTNSQSQSTYVVGSATGTVEKSNLLTAGGASSGDYLVLLFDRNGKIGEHYKLGWDSVTEQDSEAVIQRLSTMNELAELRLVHASKDVSTAGLIGTAGMLLEYSGKGGYIDLDAIEAEIPNTVSLEDWLRMYISLGFLVAVPPEKHSQLSSIGTRHGMAQIVVGRVDDSESLRLQLGEAEKPIFDFSHGPVLTPK